MEEYVYLIRNGDLYNLGYSKNLEQTKENLTPGKLFAYLKTNNANSLCSSLQQKYLEERLPNTDYFRLNKSQLLECQLIMKNHGDKKYFEPIFKGKTLFFTFIFSWICISFLLIELGLEPIFKRLF